MASIFVANVGIMSPIIMSLISLRLITIGFDPQLVASSSLAEATWAATAP